VVKSTGEPSLILGPDRWLVLAGASSKLEECVKRFLVEEEDGHTHLYTAPIALIIESDSDWERIGLLVSLATADIIALLPVAAFDMMFSPLYLVVLYAVAFIAAPWVAERLPITWGSTWRKG
jgi:hypothetical protein